MFPYTSTYGNRAILSNYVTAKRLVMLVQDWFKMRGKRVFPVIGSMKFIK